MNTRRIAGCCVFAPAALVASFVPLPFGSPEPHQTNRTLKSPDAARSFALPSTLIVELQAKEGQLLPVDARRAQLRMAAYPNVQAFVAQNPSYRTPILEFHATVFPQKAEDIAGYITSHHDIFGDDGQDALVTCNELGAADSVVGRRAAVKRTSRRMNAVTEDSSAVDRLIEVCRLSRFGGTTTCNLLTSTAAPWLAWSQPPSIWLEVVKLPESRRDHAVELMLPGAPPRFREVIEALAEVPPQAKIRVIESWANHSPIDCLRWILSGTPGKSRDDLLAAAGSVIGTYRDDSVDEGEKLCGSEHFRLAMLRGIAERDPSTAMKKLKSMPSMPHDILVSVLTALSAVDAASAARFHSQYLSPLPAPEPPAPIPGQIGTPTPPRTLLAIAIARSMLQSDKSDVQIAAWLDTLSERDNFPATEAIARGAAALGRAGTSVAALQRIQAISPSNLSVTIELALNSLPGLAEEIVKNGLADRQAVDKLIERNRFRGGPP